MSANFLGSMMPLFALLWPQAAPQNVPPHETYSGPKPATPARVTQAPPGPAFFVDLPVSVQVNIDADGMNVIGDAANEPTIAIDPTNPNRVVIGWREFATIQSSFREAGVAYSRDAGRSWTNPGVLAPGTFRTDPVLAADHQGNFYYHSLYGTQLLNCDVFKSSDGGKTWAAPVEAGGGDKNWLNVDQSGGSSDGHVYTVWRRDFSCCGPNIFNRSTNGGVLFEPPVPVSQNPALGTIAVGPDGEVYVGGVVIGSWSAYRLAKSTNARDPLLTPTFSTVAVNLGGALGFFAGGPNPGGLLGQVWVVTDHSGGPTRGNVYMLCSVDPPGADPMDLHIVRSTDGGLTFGPPVRINDDPAGTNAWQWFGTLSIAPNGRLDAAWCDTRDSGQTNVSRVYYSFSTDAGQTWAPNVAITPPFDSTIGYPMQNKIGDYYHMVSDNVGASLAYSATFAGGQDIYFVRIGDFDCNGNGVSDTLDISQGASADVNGNGIPDECECVGDLNGDGVVGQSDLGLLLSCFGQPGQACGDLTGDGETDQADLGVLLASYGRVCD
ncbi:MAG: hypothetical protein LC135_13580 [Phycisphaerae bacterium]|nr:hypothetical protein [Phycisphaerae bacterium]MCZ2400882.1 hypothetical protein [Phycisphaerae bacterium]NUQ48927.1 hypothetical protein [Phycisphaerae bacterium]